MKAILIGGEAIANVQTSSKVCNRCRNTACYNMFTIGKELLNCIYLDQMKDAGALFITSKIAFTIPYLEMTYLRLL